MASKGKNGEDRVAIVAAHTNLDSARGGLNDVMCEILGIGPAEPLRPDPGEPGAGLGRIGAVRPITLASLVERVATVCAGWINEVG